MQPPSLRPWMLLITATLGGAPDPGDGPAIPADLVIVAESHAPPLVVDPPKNWECRITADGRVARRFGYPTKEPGSLPEAAVRDLVAAIAAARFAELRASYDAGLTDQPWRALTVTIGGQRHRVVIEGRPREQDVARFERVWSEVLKKVPPPNPDEAPDRRAPRTGATARQ